MTWQNIPRRGVVGVLVVATVAVMLACGGNFSLNPETLDLKAGKEATRYVKFTAGVKAEIWVTSEKDSDVDLFVFDDTGAEVAKDDGLGKDCYVQFEVARTQLYKVVIQNRVHMQPPHKGRNGDNKVTLKWTPMAS